MSFSDLDLMARGGGIALLVLWSALLVRDHWQATSARIALVLNVTIVCHIIASMPGMMYGLSGPAALLDIGSSSVIGIFWLFTRTWFEDRQRVGLFALLLAMLPFLMVASAHILGIGADHPANRIFFPVLRVIWFGLTIHALWTAWRGRDDDLMEWRRRHRLQVVVATGVLALVVNIIEIAVFRFGAAPEWRSIPEFGLTIVALLLSMSMFQHKHPDQFGPPRKSTSDVETIPDRDDPLATRLLSHMDSTLPHRDEGLTIAGLAGQLGVQEYQLRRLINGTMGHRNFAQFLNGYRLAEVKAALADPSQKDVPILTIALDAGFGSLGPFNRAFRDAEGMTPSAYRADQGAGNG